MRLLLRGEYYVPLASEAMLESEYEKLIAQEADQIFPEFVLVPFKALIEADAGSARPDFALVDRAYRTWWVVEVELSHHSLERHVRPQVEILSTGIYGDREGRHLARSAPALDSVRILEMVRGSQPRVLIVVDEAGPDWVVELGPYGALVCVVQVFRSDHGRYCLRINGRQPESLGAVLSRCRMVRGIPGMLLVDSPAGLPVSDGETLEAVANGEMARWKRVDTGDGVWLVATRMSPLQAGRRVYDLIRHGDGHLELRDTRGSGAKTL